MSKDVIEIPITRGLVVTVDQIDSDLAKLKWRSCCGRAHRGGGGYPTYYMHRVIAERMGISAQDIDHKDRNPLNNCRSNLRGCTRSQNLMNQGKRPGKSSRFKGVSKCEKGRFMASITINRKVKHMGRFDSEEDAAKVYDEAASKLFGEFAVLNFPNPKERSCSS